MKEEIRSFLLENGAAPGTAVADQDSLLEAGVLDSAAMLDLILFLEKRFGVQVDEDDMVPENFDSLDSITRYVVGRSAA